MTEVYYKVGQLLQSVTSCYYKVYQVLQSATVITKWDATSSGKINKYEYLTGDEILLSNQSQIKDQAKFTYSHLGKTLKKQVKTIEDQREKQIKAFEEQGKQLIKSSGEKGSLTLVKQKELFDGLTSEKMAEIQKLNNQIDFNNLIYYFRGKKARKNVTGFKGWLGLFNSIKDGYINIKKAEENEKELRSDLNEKTKGKWEHKSEEQKSVIENVKMFYKGRENVIKFYNGFSLMISMAKYSSWGKTQNINTQTNAWKITNISCTCKSR